MFKSKDQELVLSNQQEALMKLQITIRGQLLDGAMGGIGIISKFLISEDISKLYPYTKLSPDDPDYIGEGQARGLAFHSDH